MLLDNRFSVIQRLPSIVLALQGVGKIVSDDTMWSIGNRESDLSRHPSEVSEQSRVWRSGYTFRPSRRPSEQKYETESYDGQLLAELADEGYGQPETMEEIGVGPAYYCLFTLSA
jgi:hypothetical protein